MATKKKAVKQLPYRALRYGILNHLGGIWTPETFTSMEGAQAHLNDARRTWPDGGEGLRKHKVVAVRITVSPCG